MKEAKYKIGDVVRLKGSMAHVWMTIEYAQYHEDFMAASKWQYHCVWMYDGLYHDRIFIEDCLIEITKEQ